MVTRLGKNYELSLTKAEPNSESPDFTINLTFSNGERTEEVWMVGTTQEALVGRVQAMPALAKERGDLVTPDIKGGEPKYYRFFESLWGKAEANADRASCQLRSASRLLQKAIKDG